MPIPKYALNHGTWRLKISSIELRQWKHLRKSERILTVSFGEKQEGASMLLLFRYQERSHSQSVFHSFVFVVSAQKKIYPLLWFIDYAAVQLLPIRKKESGIHWCNKSFTVTGDAIPDQQHQQS